jgi:serine protease
MECRKLFTISFFLIFTLFSNAENIKQGNNTPQIIQKGKLIYLAHTIVIKYKNAPNQGILKSQNIENVLKETLKDYKVQSINKLFSIENENAKKIGLDRIELVNYSKEIDPLYATAKIKKFLNIEWAEPKFLRKIDFIPNDPSYNSNNQWNLFQVDAQQAWDISQGDTSIIIGIIDTGIDWTHPDLAANMWPGIGFDFGGLNGTPDNNPIEDHPYHGTFLAGVASAVSNNSIGISSIGYKCHLMAVKTSRDDIKDPVSGLPYIFYGFEGIVYAADHGAKIINCSWGGGGYSNEEQDVINYAVSKGALVVAAAGNDNAFEDFYPAGYDGVLSVAATDPNDNKASFSNFGYKVDCTAPGVNIYSTWQTDTYNTGSGTSYSTPLVSGLAALVMSHFPNYNPLQVAEQIRVNSDNIDSLNSSYKYLLGYGRINAYKALENTNSISIRAYDIQFTDNTEGGNGNGNFEPGENVEVHLKLRNYLSQANNISISVESLNNYATVQNGNFNLSTLSTLDSANNDSNPFILKISDNIPFDVTMGIIIHYKADNYDDYQVETAPANPSFLTQSGNNIALTITSKGNLGFNDYPTDIQGNGFRYQGGSNLLFEGALMFGTSAEKLSDEARDETGDSENKSFQIVSPFKIGNPGGVISQKGNTIFNDNGSGTNKLNVAVNLNSYSINDINNNNSIILRYNFTNNSGSDINNFYAGIFFDWDLLESSGDNDNAVYDNIGNLGYVYHENGNPDTYVGTALVSSDNYGFWAIANGDTTKGNLQIYDGFTKNEKWQTLSSGIGKSTAGPEDISEVTSAGPFAIPTGQSINVAFAVTAGSNLDELRTNINNARTTYNNLLTSINDKEIPLVYSLSQNYPNPFNPATEINYEIPKEGKVTIKVYDILGNLVKTLIDENKQAGNYHLRFFAGNLASGVYFYQLKVNGFSAAKKFVLLK